MKLTDRVQLKVRFLLFVSLIFLGACAGTRRPAPAPVPAAVPSSVELSLYLIGDAGEPDPAGEPVFKALRADIQKSQGEKVLVWLGDNIYPKGLPDSSHAERAEMERRIDAQIDVITANGARGIFIPGNHDWAKGGKDGWQAVLRQEKYVREHGGNKIQWLPPGGCPGPSVVDVGARLRIIALDPQWFLQKGPKPSGEESSCRAGSEEEVLTQLKDALLTAGERHVVIVAHQPLMSGGPHGGHFTWKDHIFPLTGVQSWLWIPLPIVGSAYPLSRQAGISNQDMAGSANKRMREAFASVLTDKPPLVWAGGHEHVLEVFEGSSARYILVSGAGYYGHTSATGWRDQTLYSASASGFMRVDLVTDGSVRLGVLVVDENGQADETFSIYLVKHS